MPGKFVSFFVLPVTTVAVVGTVIRSQAKPSKAHTQYIKATDKSQWIKVNDGLGVNDVGRSCGGV